MRRKKEIGVATIVKYVLPLAMMMLSLVVNVCGQRPVYDEKLLAKIRRSASSIAGPRATGVRYIRFAASPRTLLQTVEGGQDTAYNQVRTAYQLVFPASTIMIDAGMDRKVHAFFGNGKDEPYFDVRNDSIHWP